MRLFSDMVEIMEYSLVLLTSVLFAGSGVYIFAAYALHVGEASASATFSSIVSAAYSSIEGNSERRVVAFLSNATISCRGGTLSYRSGSSRLSAAIPVDCNFSYEGLSGVRTLAFRGAPTGLTLKVG